MWARSLAVVVLCLSILGSDHVFGETLGRKDAVRLIHGIEADYDSPSLSLKLEGLPDENDPGVFVGDPIGFEFSSTQAQYYLMVMVDPKGTVSVIFPDFAIEPEPQSYQSFRYPPEGTGELTQQEPVGIETVFLFASENPVSMSAYGFPSDSDVHVVGNDEASVLAFVEKSNEQLSELAVAAIEYQYFVDFPDLQFDTRAVRRELKRRIEQVNVLATTDKIDPGNPQNSDITTADSATLNSPGQQQAGIRSDALAVNDIRFETNSDQLTSVGKSQLDVIGGELINLLEDNPQISVFLEGHTDDTGERLYNQALSERRAASAKQYLLDEFGISDARLVTMGQGEDRPLSRNTDTVSRALNRRVEIRIGVNSR